MEPRHLIRAAIAVSVVGHLALAAGVYLADARPMEPLEDHVSVDLVTPQDLAEAEKKAEETPPEPEKQSEPKPQFRLPELSDKQPPNEPKAQATAPKPQPEQSNPSPPQPPPPHQQQQSAQLSPPPQQQSAQPPPSQQPAAAPAQSPPPSAQPPSPQQQAALQPPPPPAEAVPPQPDPDITVKYGVMLGLPGFGGAASEQADLGKLDIAAFHRHLRTCLKLPPGIARTDDAMVKLRATLSPDGRLTAEPTVIEVRRPAKAAMLMQAAKQALQDCQPYSMLPADKYNEWKVLDLPFTPQDFAG